MLVISTLISLGCFKCIGHKYVVDLCKTEDLFTEGSHWCLPASVPGTSAARSRAEEGPDQGNVLSFTQQRNCEVHEAAFSRNFTWATLLRACSVLLWNYSATRCGRGNFCVLQSCGGHKPLVLAWVQYCMQAISLFCLEKLPAAAQRDGCCDSRQAVVKQVLCEQPRNTRSHRLDAPVGRELRLGHSKAFIWRFLLLSKDFIFFFSFTVKCVNNHIS